MIVEPDMIVKTVTAMSHEGVLFPPFWERRRRTSQIFDQESLWKFTHAWKLVTSWRPRPTNHAEIKKLVSSWWNKISHSGRQITVESGLALPGTADDPYRILLALCPEWADIVHKIAVQHARRALENMT